MVYLGAALESFSDPNPKNEEAVASFKQIEDINTQRDTEAESMP